MSDKRREKRTGRKLLAAIQEPKGECPAVIHNLSGHGLNLRTTREFPEGATVKLLLQPQAPHPVAVEGRICWCSRRGGESDSVELGLQLESAPPDFFDLLLALPGGGLEEQLRNLSAMPVLILDLMALVNDSATSVKRIEEKIKTDQAMVAYLLKAVNSSYYALPKPATSIRHALQVTGFATLKSLLHSYFVRQLTYLAGDRATQQRLWQHALAVALTSREAAQATGLDPDEAYTAGLLHDIGKAVLLAADAATYLPVLREALAAPESSLRVESRLLGYSHVDAGLYVMERWNFSALQREVVGYHHRPRSYPGHHPAVEITAFANQLVLRQAGREPDPEELCPTPAALQGVPLQPLFEKALAQVPTLS